MMIETRHRLKEWGQWARGGFPIVSSMFHGLFGSKGADPGDMPKHIQEIDHIVCVADKEIRIILVSVYGMGGSFREKALTLGVDRMTLKRRLERAEWHVNAVLDGFEPAAVHSVTACKQLSL